MALTDSNGNMVMPVSPMYGGYGNGGGMFGGDWGSWIILFLIVAMWGGFGNGGFGGNNFSYDFPWLLNANKGTDAAVQAGFNNAALTSQLSGIQSSISNGFSGVEISACNKAMDQMQATYNSQIAAMNQNFALQQSLANCCCENRLGLANLGADIAREACADRASVSDALRDVLAANTASTQRILDKMCDQELQAERRANDQLRQELNMANLAASQTAQTARILSDNAAQTQAIENYVRPQVNPAYIVPNPYAYNYVPSYSCGCNQGCGFSGAYGVA